MLDDARPGDLALLRHMADENNRCTGLLCIADHGLGAGPHLRHCARSRIGGVGPQCLDRIDDDQVWPLCVGDRCQNVLDIGFRRKQHIRIGRMQPLGAQPDLCHRFFTRNIDDAVALACQRGSCLRKQCGFADPGIAADEDRRTANKTTTGNAVKFADP